MIGGRSGSITGTFVVPVLRGSGQMLFQPSARTGGVFLLLILSQSPWSLGMCMTGILGATLCAYVVEHPNDAYFKGEGGFNGGLLGLSLSALVEYDPVLPLVGFAGGMLTSLVRATLLRLLPAPPFTAPFVIVAWVAFTVCMNVLGLGFLDPPWMDAPRIQALTTNASQVLFLLDSWVGILVIAAVLLHSWAAALWVALASVVAYLTTLAFSLPAELAAAGLLGYNGLILSAALQRRDTPMLPAAAGVVATVWLSYLFLRAGVTPLSAPFVLSAWLIIAVQALQSRWSPKRG